jgi:L-aspartate oxidase
VLATGGLGQVFSSTTNPSVSTGDGVALALRAGAEVADLEFVQFHPTALFLGAASRGQQPLVSEAMRGEGAVLLDASGNSVMAGAHPLADLAPRDVVAKQMSRVMAAEGTDHLFLDARPLGRELLESRFPTIVARCREAGIDPLTAPIPVTPAAHYASGGVVTDLAGRTTVAGLYACGEVACTGVHGANRLASNSLLEGLVFAARIAEDLAGGLPESVEMREPAGHAAYPAVVVDPAARGELQRAMTDGAGVLRSAASLEAAAKALASLTPGSEPSPAAWETTGLHAVATVLVAAARQREETRGAHWREDFAAEEPAWQERIVAHLDADGELQTRRVPVVDGRHA